MKYKQNSIFCDCNGKYVFYEISDLRIKFIFIEVCFARVEALWNEACWLDAEMETKSGAFTWLCNGRKIYFSAIA